MPFISDTLFLHWKTPWHEVSRLLSRWLSGSRDRHAGPEGPPRKKRKRQQQTTAGPSVADVSECPSGGDAHHAPSSSPGDGAGEGGGEAGEGGDLDEEPHSMAAGMRIMAEL